MVFVDLDRVIFFDLFEIANVINSGHRRVLLPAILAKLAQIVAEKVVAADYHDVVVEIVRTQHEMKVTDGAEFVAVVGAVIVDDREREVQMWTVAVGPLLKMTGELFVRYHIRMIDGVNRREVVEHVLKHRLARDGQQRLGLVEC